MKCLTDQNYFEQKVSKSKFIGPNFQNCFPTLIWKIFQSKFLGWKIDLSSRLRTTLCSTLTRKIDVSRGKLSIFINILLI